MPKFTAVMGKSGTNRIVTVEADDEEAARTEITRQLHRNSQRRDIWQQWQASGAAILSQELEEAFDEESANALIRGRLAELLAELSVGTVSVPAAVYEAYGRAKAALKAFEDGWEAKQRER